eukprot:TCALIF_05035-PA protein Name:"Similar to mtSSB Single-stranded DNA-binding protein, mitochondrial (Drosophila melanogaster)" AED:0.11 eAED:0.11 QI:0/0/0.5/0.5/1/1/2/132/152
MSTLSTLRPAVRFGARAFSTPMDPAEGGSPGMDENSRAIEKSINSVTLLGRVGVNPQLRGTENHPVVTFSLATNVRYKSTKPDTQEETWQVKTDWHNIAVYRPYLRTTIHENVTKGQRVLVQGRIIYGSIEDNMGNTRHTTTIVADDVIRFA